MRILRGLRTGCVFVRHPLRHAGVLERGGRGGGGEAAPNEFMCNLCDFWLFAFIYLEDVAERNEGVFTDVVCT